MFVWTSVWAYSHPGIWPSANTLHISYCTAVTFQQTVFALWHKCRIPQHMKSYIIHPTLKSSFWNVSILYLKLLSKLHYNKFASKILTLPLKMGLMQVVLKCHYLPTNLYCVTCHKSKDLRLHIPAWPSEKEQKFSFTCMHANCMPRYVSSLCNDHSRAWCWFFCHRM